MSPYFVPTKNTIEGIREIIERGVDVTVITNSLAATNHPMVHSGYGPSRKALLKTLVSMRTGQGCRQFC